MWSSWLDASPIGWRKPRGWPKGQELAKATEIATTIAKQAPLAVQASLVNARVAIEKGHDVALAEMMGLARKLMESEDAKEGVASFVERREAVFKGR